MGLASVLRRAPAAMAGNTVANALARMAEETRQSGGLPLRIVLPDRSVLDFGPAVRVTLRVTDANWLRGLPQLTLGALGDAFVGGQIDIDGDLLDALPVGVSIAEAAGASMLSRLVQAWRPHRPEDDASAIRHHYDVGNDFYGLWLDQRMVYSCAYFRRGDETIDEAQRAKLDHICRKLRLAPGERLLDVGCGWGGLLVHAALNFGVSAVGITLSENQAQLARERLQRAGVADRVQVLLLDYRELPQRFGPDAFDKVASVGMFEHVGIRNLSRYFSAIAAVLRDRGLFLNHGITSSDVDNRPVGGGVSDFIERHVFPYGELPHLHVAVRDMSAAGFEIGDVESLRPHYARTLEYWYRRLEARSAEAERLVSQQVLRTWRVYLAGCSYGFRQGWVNIYQLLGSLGRTPGPTALPWTRDWIYA
jgi:cyclopropane-fatty-acyl-phospholipid synthase